MRCFFLRAGHIVGVEMLTELSDQDAIATAHLLFSERRTKFDGFEVWDGARIVIRHPDPLAAEPEPGANGEPSTGDAAS